MSGRTTVVTPRPVVPPRARRQAPDDLVSRLSDRLTALTPDEPTRYGVQRVVPGDAPWLTPDWALDAMLLAPGEHLAFSPAVAGARLAGTLGYAALGRLAVALTVTGQAYDTGPDSLLVALDDGGLVDRIGVRRGTVAVVASDRLAALARRADDDVVVLPDHAALVRWAAGRAWPTLSAWIEQIHDATGFGVVPAWNLVADTVLGPVTTAAGLAGQDPWAARATGDALLDELVGLGAKIRRRGSACGPAPSIQRGACCLVVRQTGETCTGCPVLRLR